MYATRLCVFETAVRNRFVNRISPVHCLFFHQIFLEIFPNTNSYNNFKFQREISVKKRSIILMMDLLYPPIAYIALSIYFLDVKHQIFPFLKIIYKSLASVKSLFPIQGIISVKHMLLSEYLLPIADRIYTYKITM